jgi:hypothetical protein
MMITFTVLLPFSKAWKEFKRKAGIEAEAFELKLRDFGMQYTKQAVGVSSREKAEAEEYPRGYDQPGGDE